VGDASAIARDTAAIVEWQNAPEGPRKTALFNALFRAKRGLIRQLTQKAARAEKTAEDTEDLLQAGAIGFQKALERFEAGRGLSISTYAAWWIRHEVQRVARRANHIALPRIRLTNAEREKVITAIRHDPDVEPESCGVRRSQFEQVKASYGIRYVSDGTPRGAGVVERKLLSDAGVFDGEEALDEARRQRTMRGILFRVRAGMTAEQLGLTPEVYQLALDVIRIDEQEKSMSETEETGTTETQKPKRKYTRRSAAAKSRARSVPEKAKPEFRDVLVKRILGSISTLPDAALLDLFERVVKAA
jgi:RNA polymerase sigma factor (sigma-70 family)